MSSSHFISESSERLAKVTVAKQMLAGLTTRDIAVQNKLPQDLIEMWRDRDTEFRTIQNQLLDGAIEDAKNILSHGAIMAARALVDALNCASDTAKVRAAVEVLNRVGMPAVEKHEVSQTARFSSMTDDELMKQLDESLRLISVRKSPE